MIKNDKEALLQSITDAAKNRLITKKELLTAYDRGSDQRGNSDIIRSLTLTELFSSIGCGIIFIGIAILISQHWHSFTAANKVILTLGSGIAAYLMGLLFSRDVRVRMISSSFFLLSALLIPLGLAVALQVAGYNIYTYGFYAVISGITLLIFLISHWLFKKDFFLFFMILFATWFFYDLVNFLYKGINPDFNLYCTIVVGLSYILLGSYYENRSKYALTAFLYGFGSLGFLGSLFALDILHKGSICEWSFPLILFVMMYLSVRLKSTSFLTFSVVFLILWILEITDRYFSLSLGWPIALVVMGFLLILIAYFYFQIKKRYFK